MTQPPRDGVPTDPGAPVIAEPDLAPGQTLADRYRLLERLGGGGFGTVWRALDQKLDEEVALKIVDPSGEVTRWRREVALARRVAHPNVCRVFDLGEASGCRFVTMERIAGESLRSIIERGPPPAAEIEALIPQLVAGVAAIHRAGVIHRDLKPDNVVVEPGGRAVIVDFGLARSPGPTAGSRVTRSGAVLGTPSYMAPEQAMGRPTDARSDVYALGLVIFELCTGKLPNEAVTAAESPGAKSDPAPRSEAPPRWAPIIDRCLKLEPAARFADAGAILASLEGPTPRRPRRRLPGWAIAAAALVAIGGAATIAVVASGGDPVELTGDLAVAPPPAPLTERQLTFTAPESQPLSAAVSADGSEVAYSIGGAVYRRDIGGRDRAALALPAKEPPVRAALAYVVGFFPGGDIAVRVRDRRGDHAVWRIGGGEPRELYAADEGFEAALSPDGDELAVAVAGLGVLVVPLAGGGSERTVASSRIGEGLGPPAWSPDGARVAFARRSADADTVEVAPAREGGTRVAARRPRGALGDLGDHLLVWSAPDRILFAERSAGGSALFEVGPGGGEVRERASWPGRYLGRGGLGGGLAVIAGGVAIDAVTVAKTSKPRRYVYGLERAQAGARRLAGWTPDGALVFSVDNGVHHQIVAAIDSHSALLASDLGGDLLADAVAGSAVLYQRPGDNQVDIWRHEVAASGEDRRITGVSAPRDRPAVRCAGERSAPCVIEDRTDGVAIYRLFDPETGTRGDELHRVPDTPRPPRAFALAPNGRDLALVDGSNSVTTVVDGRVERTAIGEGTELTEISWSFDGASLLVSGAGYKRRRFSLIRLVLSEGDVLEVEKSDHQRYGRTVESADGERVALETRDFDLDLWVIEGL